VSPIYLQKRPILLKGKIGRAVGALTLASYSMFLVIFLGMVELGSWVG